MVRIVGSLKTGEIGDQVKAGNEMPSEHVKDILLTAIAMYMDSKGTQPEDPAVERAHADLRELIDQWVFSCRTTQEVIQNTGKELSELEDLQRALLESIHQQQEKDLEDSSGDAAADVLRVDPPENSEEFAAELPSVRRAMALQVLSKVVGASDARTEDMSTATDNAVSAIGLVIQHHSR